MEHSNWQFISDPQSQSTWAKISPDGKKILTKEISYDENNKTDISGAFICTVRFYLIDVETCKKSET